MEYDLLIKNGTIVDGSGSLHAFRGDIGISQGKIAEIGRLRAPASRTIDADGLVVAPGFIDTHCHYDAQVTWDPLCSDSCYHGATTVIIGNCSLSLAPVRQGGEERLREFLSYVEAIPIETLQTVDLTWNTFPEYMNTLDKRLGVNVGNLMGHSAIRYYVMGDESQVRTATSAEIGSMCDLVREGMLAGALGFSMDRNTSHFDANGVAIPSVWADETEIFALGDVLAVLGTGVIQSGDGRRAEAELKKGLMTRLSDATGRQVVYNTLGHLLHHPDICRQHMAKVDETVKTGVRANPMCSPNQTTHRFTMRNTQVFRGVPTWHPILVAPDEEKLRAYRNPEVRRKLHEEVIEWKQEILGNPLFSKGWHDAIWVAETILPKNKPLRGKSLTEVAQLQNKGIIDAFLDLAVEENLETVFYQGVSNTDKDAMIQILTYPNAYMGLSDGGAHVQFHGGTGYSSRFLGHWVRKEHIMTLEQAVRRLTFENATVFGIYDRGLLHPGLVADITIFDPNTIDALPEEIVHDFPAGAWRYQEKAAGIHYTIVNGQVLLENGTHTGALPGRIIRNSLHKRLSA